MLVIVIADYAHLRFVRVCVCVCVENQFHCRSSPSVSIDTPYKHTRVHTRHIPCTTYTPNSWQFHTQAFCEQVWYIETFHQTRAHPCHTQGPAHDAPGDKAWALVFPKLQTLLSVWAEATTPRELCRAPSMQVSWCSRFFQVWKFVAKTPCCHVRISMALL